MNEVTRILIVDDHEVVRIGMAALLQRRAGFQVVGEAGTTQEAIAQATQCQPDVVIMDIRLPDGSGIEACREIRALNPNIRVVMLTSYADDEALFSSMMAGAEGYVLKMIGSDALVRAVETVARGEPLLDPSISRKLMNYLRLRQEERQREETLTEQEKRILALIAEGKTNKEIAQEVFLSEKTVRNHVSSILGKLGFTNRTQAAAYALRRQS
ncbi:LuxR family transcriptional regulator [Clostridiales bacterium PH28_bin88]|nr:LuxR family transcriptional regulator [Clostridiales bacterium PH28_bin88]